MYVQPGPHKTLLREDCNENLFSGESSNVFNIRYLIPEDCDENPFGREYSNSLKSMEDIRYVVTEIDLEDIHHIGTNLTTGNKAP